MSRSFSPTPPDLYWSSTIPSSVLIRIASCTITFVTLNCSKFSFTSHLLQSVSFASNTCIVAFQLMQVIDLQTIQIMARFCQGDILAMKRIQYGARKCVAENVRGFSVAVLPAAPLLFRNSLGRPPCSVSGILRLG